MFTDNVVILRGHLGSDPEFVDTRVGNGLVNLSVATNSRWTRDGQQHERTDWHRVTAFGWQCDRVKDLDLRRGAPVHIVGELRCDEKLQPDGTRKYYNFVKAHAVNALVKLPRRDGPPGGPPAGLTGSTGRAFGGASPGSSRGGETSGGYRPPAQTNPAQTNPSQTNPSQTNPSQTNMVKEADIPF